MKIRTLIMGLLAASFCFWAGTVLLIPADAYATTTDKIAILKAGQAVDGLASIVNESNDTTSTQFYDSFAPRILKARKTILTSYGQLKSSSEQGRTKEALTAIRRDINVMAGELNSWHTAAIDKNAEAFDSTSNDLNATIEQFNDDVIDYNVAKDGGKSTKEIAANTVGSVFAFALLSFLLAWAVASNQQQEEIVAELKRRLRWRMVWSTAGTLAGAVVPTLLYFVGELPVPGWTRFLILPGLAALSFTVFQYGRVIALGRRQS